MRRSKFVLLFSAFVCFSPLLSEAEPFSALQSRFEKQFGGPTAISVRDIQTGKELLSVGSERMLMPASCQKLLTSYVALKNLGGEFTFLTEFYLSAGAVPILTIRGHGDPTLTDERIWKVADDLYRAGVRQIGGIVLDGSLFIESRPRTGLNPYQAAQSALSADYNSLSVRAQLFQGEVRSSLSSFSTAKLESAFKVGSPSSISLDEDAAHVIHARGVVSNDGTVVEDYIAVSEPERLFGELVTGIFSARGIHISSLFKMGQVSAALSPVFVSKSKDLAQILPDLNRFSLNFVANQIVYALGETAEGRYSFAQGLEVIRREALAAGISAAELRISDGSGLSREDTMTPSALTKVITAAMKDPAIAPDFQASLPRFGKRGTLRHRSLGVAGQESIWAKTGSLDGVSSVAGTIPAEDHLLAFAIITNGNLTKAEAIEREDEIVRSVFLALHSSSSERSRSR